MIRICRKTERVRAGGGLDELHVQAAAPADEAARRLALETAVASS
jgi:hypothetical protein